MLLTSSFFFEARRQIWCENLDFADSIGFVVMVTALYNVVLYILKTIKKILVLVGPNVCFILRVSVRVLPDCSFYVIDFQMSNCFQK